MEDPKLRGQDAGSRNLGSAFSTIHIIYDTRPAALTHSLSHLLDEDVDLVLKVGGVVDHVDVGMSHPRLGRLGVAHARLLQPLAPRGVVVHRVKLLGALRRRDHVDHLSEQGLEDFSNKQKILLVFGCPN